MILFIIFLACMANLASASVRQIQVSITHYQLMVDNMENYGIRGLAKSV